MGTTDFLEILQTFYSKFYVSHLFKLSISMSEEQNLFLEAVSVIGYAPSRSCLGTLLASKRFAKKLSSEMVLVLAFIIHGHDDVAFGVVEQELGITLKQCMPKLDSVCQNVLYDFLERRASDEELDFDAEGSDTEDIASDINTRM